MPQASVPAVASAVWLYIGCGFRVMGVEDFSAAFVTSVTVVEPHALLDHRNDFLQAAGASVRAFCAADVLCELPLRAGLETLECCVESFVTR